MFCIEGSSPGGMLLVGSFPAGWGYRGDDP